MAPSETLGVADNAMGVRRLTAVEQNHPSATAPTTDPASHHLETPRHWTVQPIVHPDLTETRGAGQLFVEVDSQG